MLAESKVPNPAKRIRQRLRRFRASRQVNELLKDYLNAFLLRDLRVAVSVQVDVNPLTPGCRNSRRENVLSNDMGSAIRLLRLEQKVSRLPANGMSEGNPGNGEAVDVFREVKGGYRILSVFDRRIASLTEQDVELAMVLSGVQRIPGLDTSNCGRLQLG
jgi:hypothetical protein